MAFRDYSAVAKLFCRIAAAQLKPQRPRSLQQRLAMLPVCGALLCRDVEIHWDAHQVPFIEAETDDDLATALGVVHGHLRLGQMELMRRIARGRVAEFAGPIALPLDRLIRTFDIARAVPEIISRLPLETRHWLEAFARGVDHVSTRAPERPRECTMLGIVYEPWTLADIVLLGRLIAVDVNWIVWTRLLKFRGTPDWPLFWKRLLRHDLLSFELGDTGPAQAFAGAAIRSGSNSFAVSGARSETKGALIANDPHLSIMLPSTFLLAGFKSPSHHGIGLMAPGIPFIALGRNPHIAWGGASLHASSSDLVTVPNGGVLRERTERIAVRGGPDVVLSVKEAEFGPVVSDLPPYQTGNETIALRWIGHTPSDEFTTMLRVGRARDFHEFRAAFADYAVPGLEMNCVEASGGIGRITAAKLPRRKHSEPEDIFSPCNNGWDDPITPLELPSRYDPVEGFLASANARPEEKGAVVGLHFSPPDRVQRLRRLLASEPRMAVKKMMQLQRDVHLALSVVQRDAMLSWMGEPDKRAAPHLVSALRSWDGNYEAASHGALAFELLFYHLARALVPAARQSAYEAAWGTRALIWDDVLATPDARRAQALTYALKRAARDFGRGKPWGSLHRLRLAPSARDNSRARTPLPFARLARVRHVGDAYENRAWPDQQASSRTLRFDRAACIGHVRCGCELFRAPRRTGRLVRQQHFRRSSAVVAGRPVHRVAPHSGNGAQELCASPDSDLMIDGTPFLKLYSRMRGRELDRENAAEAQEQQLLKLLRRAANTRFGNDHRFEKIRSVADYQGACRYAVTRICGAIIGNPPFPSSSTAPGPAPFPISRSVPAPRAARRNTSPSRTR
jgi:penicillin amidase